MTRHATLVVLAAALSGACASAPNRGGMTPRSPLELRQAQSRTFEAAAPRVVLKAALNVLQDQGFVIRHADAELGIVTAAMEWQSSQPKLGLRILKWVAVVPTYGASLLLPTGRNEWSAIEANVNVTAEAAQTRVRISLVTRVTGKNGEVRRISPVDDPVVYQRLLSALDKAVFLEAEGL